VRACQGARSAFV